MTETSSPKPRHRLFVDAPLAAGQGAPLDSGQAHYLRGVLRLAPGERVTLFNGRDGEWAARLTALSKSAAEAEPEDLLRPQVAEEGPWLVFAPLKKDATDYLVQKAVELGCSRLVPVVTARSQTHRVNTDRLRAQAIEAAEQCERLTVPGVDDLRPLPRLLEEWPGERVLHVMAERVGRLPAARAFAEHKGRPAAILVGPEGGLEKSDLDAVSGVPFSTAVDLGPRILRAETAAAAALALWQALAGDWTAAAPTPHP